MLGGIKEKASPAHVSPLKANFSTGFPTKTVDSLKKYPRKPNDNDINTTNSSEEDSSNALAEIESLISPKNIAFLRSEKFQKILQESRISEEDPGARQTVPNRKATADTLNDRGSVRSSGASGNSSNYSNGGCRGSVTSNSYNDGNSGEGGSILADTDINNNNNNNNNNSRINHNYSATTNYDNSYINANSEAASTSKDRDATVSKVDIDSSNSESYSNRKKSSNNQNIVILNKESNTINSNSLAQIFDIDGRRVLGKNACCSLIDATLLKWENGDFGGLVSNPLWKESFARAVYENICSGELVTITDETSESYENDIGFSIDYFLQLLRSTVPSQSTLGARVLSSILHSRECVVHLYPYSYPISTDSFHSECSLSEAYKKISGAYNTILAGLSPLSINASNDTLRAMVAEVLGLLISATDFPSDLPAALYLATIQMKGTTPTVALMDCLKFFLVGTIEENVVRNLWSSSGALLGFPPSIMIHSNRTNQSYEEMLLYCKDRINAMDSADNELLDEPTILSTLEKQCWSDDFSLRCRWDRINAFASNDIFRKILLSSIVEAIKENLNFDNGSSISRLNETKISVGSVAVEILTVIVRNCSTDIMLMLATELRSVSVYYKHFIRRKETNSRDSFYRQQKFQRLLNILFAECCRASNAFCKYFITEFSSEIVADILLVYRELAVAVAINAKEEMTTLSWDFSIGLRLLRTGLIHGLPLELVADVLCAIYLNDKDEKFVAKIIAIEDDVTIIELCFLLEILNRKIAASINFAISDVSNPSEVKLVDDRLLELLNISIKVSNWVISYVSPQHSSNTLSELARNGTKRLVSVGIFNLLSSLMGNSINRDSKSDSSFTKILDLTSVASEGLLSTAAVYCDQYLNQVADNDKLSDLTLLYHAASQIRNLQIKCTSIFHSLAVEELMLSALEDIKKDTTPLIAWQHFELIISLKKLQVSCTIAEGRDIELRCKIVDPLSQILSCYPNTVRNGLFCWYINRLYEYFGYLDVQDFLKRICKTHSYINRPDLVKLLCLVMEKITSKKHANSLDIELLNEILSYILNHDSKLAEVKALSFLTDQLYGSNKLAITIQSFATFQLDYFTILRETSLTNKNHSLMNGFDFMWMYKVTKFVPIQILSAWFALLFDMESSYSFVHSLAVLPRAGQKLFHLVDLCKSEIFLSNLEKECEVDESNYNQVLRNFRLLAIILLEKSDESFGNEFTGELYKSISAKEVSLVNNKVSESRLIAYCEFIADAACNQVVSAEFHSIILWILVSPGMYWRVSYVVWSILSSLRLTQLLKCSSISNYADQCWTVSVLSYKHLHSTTGSKNSMCRVLLKALFSCRGDFTVVENVVAKLITSYIFGDILSGSTFILNSSMGNVLLEVVSSLKFTKQAGNQEAVNSLAIDSLIRTILRSLLGKSNRATSAAPVSGKASLKSILIQLSEDSRKYLQVDCTEISLLEILEKLKPIALLDLV